ncbi:nectin-4 isoform 2-T2 [Anableps anableps]
MESIRTTELLLLLLLLIEGARGAFVQPIQPSTDLRSFTDTQTKLPCLYQAAEGEKVVQVTWNKVLPDGSDDPIIMAHFTDGNREFGRYSGRVKFESFTPTTESSALLIPATQESDEGTYTCHISTFPNGNFERHIKLTVWTLPISSLDPVDLVEGQPYGVVASCRAVGRPIPRLSWDTELPGRSLNRTSEGGAVSIHYSLHPLRSMNGKKLDCLVWHPGLEKPRRISNRLVVQYPPDPSISSPTSHWYVGLEKAELVCEGGGYPNPQSFTWTWKGGALPDGVSVVGEKLVFGRAVQLNDTGTYECMVSNAVGSGKTDYALAISEKSRVSDVVGDNLLLIIIGATAGALVLVLVIVVLVVRRRHQRKTKKLKMELQETKEEMNSLSRQASFRRLNSTSSVSRNQERTHYKDSQSTLGGRWGPTGEVPRDEYGRPVVWSDDRESLRAAERNEEKEERRKWVESYVKNSNMSLDSGLPSSLVPLKAQQDDGNGHKEPDLGHLQEGDSPPGDSSISDSTTEGHEDDDERSPQQLSATLSKMFYARNGVLRPIENPNAILLHSQKYYKPQII